MTWTKEEILDDCSKKRVLAREWFEERGSHPCVTIFFASLEDGRNGHLLVPMQDNDKDQYARMLRAVGADPMVSGSLLIFEGWLVNFGTLPDAAARAQWAGRLHEHPDRKESLRVQLEHPLTGPRSWSAEISRREDGSPVLGPWTLEEKPARAEGRFVNLTRAAGSS